MLKLLYVLCLTCIKTQRSDRIVNGRPANLGELPFQVSLRRAYNDFHFCGGTIITPKHVLTAAHCCFYTWGGQLPPEIVSVFAGSSVFRNATQIIVHVDRARNDIALIALHDNFPVSKTISPITLNTQLVPANTSCFVSGWGATHFVRKHVTDLLVAEVFTVAESLCAEEYDVIGVKIHQGEICAANDFTSSDACQGDSGGPLVCEGRLVGVVSTGNKCAKRGFPGIYTDVSFYLSWIDETLRQTW